MNLNEERPVHAIGPRAALVRLPRPARLALGIIGCAVVAFYVPLLVVTMTGVWTNRIFMLDDVAVESSIMAVVSLVGYFTGRVWIVSFVVIGLFLAYLTQHFVRSPAVFNFGMRWPDFFHPATALLLNSWLLQRYIKSVGLSKAKA